jgi:hypothetical protein
MRFEEARRTLRSLCAELGGRALPHLEQTLGWLSESVIEERSAYHLFELGLSSLTPTRVQLNHVHSYGVYRGRLANWLSIRKAEGVFELMRELGGKRGFELKHLGKILALFIVNRSAFCRTLFSLEFDLGRGALTKCTLYGHVEGRQQGRLLCRLLGVTLSHRILEWLGSSLWNVGIDFFPRGGHQLKIYKRWKLSWPSWEASPLKPLLSSLDGVSPLRDFGFVFRVKPSGQLEWPVKWGVGFSRKTHVRDLYRAEPLAERFSGFLGLAGRHLGDLELS